MLSLSSNVKERAWPRVKRPARLSEALNRSLNGYSLAAAAAGVSILASAMPAEGAPVCGNISTLLEHTNTLPFNPAGQPASPFNFAQTTFQYFLSTTGVRSLRWFQGCFTSPTKWFRAYPALGGPFQKFPSARGSHGEVCETLAVSLRQQVGIA